jgi:hypothetical protein
MIQLLNNQESVTVCPTGSKDVLDRIINAAQQIEAKGIEVVCARCSRRLFKNIAVRLAPQLGYVEETQILIGGKIDGDELKGGVLLEPIDNMLFNPKKPFTLIVKRGDELGIVTPEYE